MVAKRLPSTDVLEMHIRAGMTHQQIADRYGVARATVSKALGRAGKSKPGRPRAFTIPWRVDEDHARDYAANRLRALARRLNGEPLAPDEDRMLDRFGTEMDARGWVVDYDGTGFYPVPRRRGDRDYVRRPDA